jgi:hypothetical protein
MRDCLMQPHDGETSESAPIPHLTIIWEDHHMQIVDFSRSFMTWRIDLLKKPPATVSHKPPSSLNNARVPLDCRCEIVEKASGQLREFLLGVNCKTERVGVERDIWTEPNADFVPVLSSEQFMAIKAFDFAGRQVPFYPPSRGMQPERQIESLNDAFDSVRVDIAWCEGEALESAGQIVAAVLGNETLAARTTIENERYVALIEYPIKTMNASERDDIYQPDTGPVLFPDLSREPGDLMAGFNLAFVAFNCPDWAEFLVRAPTPVNAEVSVHHYSRSVRLDTRNQIIRIPR